MNFIKKKKISKFNLAKEETPETVIAAYGGEDLKFGKEYLIPKPFDTRLIVKLAPATAQAAMDSGVATRPIEDMDAYRQHLSHYIFETVMNSMISRINETQQQTKEYLDK